MSSYEVPAQCICKLTVRAYDKHIPCAPRTNLFVTYHDRQLNQVTVRYPNGDRRTVDESLVLPSSIIPFGSSKYIDKLMAMPVFPLLLSNEKFKARLLAEYPNIELPAQPEAEDDAGSVVLGPLDTTMPRPEEEPVVIESPDHELLVAILARLDRIVKHMEGPAND